MFMDVSRLSRIEQALGDASRVDASDSPLTHSVLLVENPDHEQVRRLHGIRLACLRFRNRPRVQDLLSLFLDPLRTVLAVQGSQRRALRRALDGSGPF